MKRRFGSFATAVASFALVCSSANAQQRAVPDKKVREAVGHFERGIALLNAANFAGAVVEFRLAFAFSQNLDTALQMHVMETAGAVRPRDAVLRIDITLQSAPPAPATASPPPPPPLAAAARATPAAVNAVDIDPSGGTKPHHDIDPTSPYGAP